MVISNVQIVPIKPQNGLVAFCSVEVDHQFYIGNIGLYSSPSSPNGFRITFPTKKVASGRIIECFHPITKDAAKAINEAIINKYLEIMNKFVM